MNKTSFNFSQFISLEDKDPLNPQILWTQPKKQKKSTALVSQYNIPSKKQSKLLRSAVARIRINRQKNQSDVVSDLESVHSSNFLFSRENTPVTYTMKKKNRHRTIHSQLFDIESENQGKRQQANQFEGLVLKPHYLGLSELIYEQVVGKQRKVNPKIIHAWKDCLTLQDRTQIYGSNAQYNFSRVFPINQLEKGFSEIYGNGKKRCLYMGQQSILKHQMQKYLQRCLRQTNKIGRKSHDILNQILENSKLTELENYPMCMKQIELLWKILATFWRYSNNLDIKQNRMLESALISGHSNFIDLKKQSPVTKFILTGSNIIDLQNSQ